MKLSLAYSPCPNDTFIFDALVHHKIDTRGYEFEVYLADVEELNVRARTTDFDITKLSYSAFGRLTDQYQILSSGSALGKNCGPLLLSATPDRQPTKHDVVGIPGEYTTANLLLSMAYPELKQKKAILFSEIEDALLRGEVDFGLVIHESRFTYQEKGLHLVRDLGQFWEETMKVPIPLGGIAIKKNLPDSVKTDLAQLIEKSVRYAFDHPESSKEYVKCHAQELDESVIQSHIDLYVNQWSIHLGADGCQAILTLLQKMQALDLVQKIAEPWLIDAKNQR